MYRKTMLFATLLLPVVAAVPLQGAQEVAGSTIVLSTFDVRAAFQRVRLPVDFF